MSEVICEIINEVINEVIAVCAEYAGLFQNRILHWKR